MAKEKKFTEEFKVFYAISLVGQLGFYIATPILIAILGGKYLDQILLDKYLLPGQHEIHYIFVLVFVLLAGIFSIWQIYRLILPMLEKDDKK